MLETNRSEMKVFEVQPRAGKVTVEKAMTEKPKTILIVEDNSLLRETLCDLLRMTHPDWQIIEAENGLAGFELAQRLQPHVILLDFNMPVMNGYELALMLQNQPETSAIPLILNSAEDTDHPLIRRLHTMCQAVLSKPFSLREIERTVANLLMPTTPAYTTAPYASGAYGEWGGNWQAAFS